MAYYLCVDGGGTKTSAVVAYVDDQGEMIARGEAGPSNLTFGLDVCLAATVEAVNDALAKLAAVDARASTTWSADVRGNAPAPFRQVWAAYAGCARPPDHELLLGPLSTVFAGSELLLTSDAQLLTAPVRTNPVVREVVTCICGTGSNGMLWRRDGGGNMVPTWRSGGWGPLLGDQGSGWALGKAAVTSVLSAVANGVPLRPWQLEVLEHFGLGPTEGGRLVVASSSLDASLPAPLADSERKKRIAACTRIAIRGAQDEDDEALRITHRVAAEVVDLLEPLVERLCGPGTLVVAGGLGQVDVFWREVDKVMALKGWTWAEVVKLPDPDMRGLRSLLE